jgi:molybdate transport system ATP-binding protein
MPIVYVSHQFDEVVRLATHVVVLEDGKVAAQGDVAQASRSAALRAIVGSEGIGAVLEGIVDQGRDCETGLTRVRIGSQSLRVAMDGARPGARARVHLLARDVLIALDRSMSSLGADVLEGTIASVEPEASQSLLVEVDVGGATVLARVPATARPATLAPGRRVSLLVNAAWSRASAPPGA